MKILVTGGCGFIGANLMKYLLEKEHRVLVFDNLSLESEENLENVCKGFDIPELIVGDVRSRDKIDGALMGVDAVVHLAAHTSVVDSLEHPVEDYQINAVGTFNVVDACRKNGVKRFVYASSNAVVGEQVPPINEEKIPAPLSPYGASKLVGESLCSAYYHSFGIKAVSLRFSNVYGPYSLHKTSVVSKFMKRVEEGKPLIIYGDGDQTRDFIHVRDICEAINLSLNYDYGGEVFQIATGDKTRIKALAQMISDLAVTSGFQRPEIVYADSRKGEIRENFSDISKARELLGFTPRIGLKEGLRMMVNSRW